MATAVLRPQDCHKLRFHHPETIRSSPLIPRRNPNPNPNANRSLRRKRSPVGLQESRGVRDADRSAVVKLPAKKLVMGQVTILKRGEDLKEPRSVVVGNERTVRFGNEDDLVLCSTDRLGPEPDMVQKQIRVEEFKVVDGLYAGSASFTSPPPSSLPFPAFFSKKEKIDAATSDLRRLLRLDLDLL